ncbi:Lamina-associated polypeptide 2, isoform alpha [Labeo rohita]|uniref:Lamina-associated polypeptide 2, isoform alpha n=1 Tax=Labeo rohita TaxID=84645 RepID=A0ABQ8MS98_LABRO|nr:Lamina-associated polypeptide 2, isoform alpha [Labeo rohita]
MASTSKAFRKCVDPCPRYLTPDDTHDLCVFCLGEEHARDVLEGAVCVHCELFPMRKLRSRLSLFSREEGQPPVPRGSGPSAAEARRKMSSWGSQVDLADELKKGLSLSRASVAGEDELLADDDVVSLTSSDPAASALLGPSQEEQEMLEDEEAEAEPFLISCPAYEELLEVMDRATVRLDLPWKRAREVAPRGRLDERYLSDHNLPAQVSLPFLPDLHTEIGKVWKRPFSSRIHNFPHSNYANIEGMREHGYQRMPPVEETLASYLSVGKASSLKTPSLPSIPLQVTSRLNGRAYAAAGQAVGALHTMAVLQAYQADLLKDLDKGQGLSPDEVAELRRTTDLALRATKQAATAMGRSMGAMVVTERHLWVNLADLGKKERGFLLDAPVSPSELFGTSVETVVEKFREARARSAAFKTFIPRRSRSEPEQYGGPGPSRSEGRRQAQKTSVATRAPPPPAGGSGRKRGSRGGRQDLREVIQTRQRARRGHSNGLDGFSEGFSESSGVMRRNHGGVLFEHPPLIFNHGYGLLAWVCLPELLDILDRHIDHRVETLCLHPALRGFGCGVSALHTDLLPMPSGDLAVAPPRSGLGSAGLGRAGPVLSIEERWLPVISDPRISSWECATMLPFLRKGFLLEFVFLGEIRCPSRVSGVEPGLDTLPFLGCSPPIEGLPEHCPIGQLRFALTAFPRPKGTFAGQISSKASVQGTVMLPFLRKGSLSSSPWGDQWLLLSMGVEACRDTLPYPVWLSVSALGSFSG